MSSIHRVGMYNGIYCTAAGAEVPNKIEGEGGWLVMWT